MRQWTTASILVLLTAPCALVAESGTASDPEAPERVTFHEHVEPILQRSCQGCHRPQGAAFGGMRAPMSLVSYEDARPWARSIARQAEARTMPPWFASDHTAGQFENERTLTGNEIETLVRWAQTGARRGDPALAPVPVEWSDWEGWMIGEPDLVVDLAEPFWIGDDIVDLNISLPAEAITEEMLPEQRWIAAAEFRPGSDAVHHIIVSKRAASAEEPGAAGMIGGIAPGSEPFHLPQGVGRLLSAGTKIWFQMHYNKEAGEGTGRWDRSQMAIKFHPADAEIEEIAQWWPIGNRDFEIPPDTSGWKVGAARTFENPVTIYSYLPHMHLRGKAAKYVAFYPDGSSELLLEVPRYDWNWQTNYTYKVPKTLPAGTRVEVSMWFENTEARDQETLLDIDPHRAVRFGGPTTDEMMLGWIDYSEKLEHAEPELDAPTAARSD